jgi:hypothetical protein
LEVAAAVTGGLESKPAELRGDVLLRQLASTGARRPALERIIRQEFQMTAENVRAHRSGDARSW